MAKTKFNDVAKTSTSQYRAVCSEGDLRGKWSKDMNAVYEEANAHQSTHQTHEVNVEEKVTQISNLKVEHLKKLLDK